MDTIVVCAGQLFPDNDPKWKGAASHIFMVEAVRTREPVANYGVIMRYILTPALVG